MWTHVLRDETPLVRRSPLLLGNLINYWITYCREICHNFSGLSQMLPSLAQFLHLLLVVYNVIITIIIIIDINININIIVAILLHISYNFLHCH